MNRKITLVVATIAVIATSLYFFKGSLETIVQHTNEESVDVAPSSANEKELLPQEVAPSVQATSEDTTVDTNWQIEGVTRIVNAVSSYAQEGKPHERYRRNIQLALEGDANALFEVSQALQTCAQSPRREELQKLKVKYADDLEVLFAIERSAAACSNLHSIVGETETSQQADETLEQAADKGHPLAVLYLTAIDGSEPSIDKRVLFSEAFELGSPDIFEVMTLYHSTHNEADDIEIAAWSMYVCELSLACSSEDAAQILMTGDFEYRSRAIVRRVEEIHRAFDQKDWSTIIPLN